MTGLVGLETIIGEITAHPPDLAQFLVVVPCKGLESVGINECIVVIIHIVFARWIWVERSTERKCFEDSFHCYSLLELILVSNMKKIATYMSQLPWGLL